VTAEARALIAEGKRHDEAMTRSPWVMGYSRIDSKPAVLEYELGVNMIPVDAADDDPRWSALPEFEVCSVPVVGGDTATAQGERDGLGIAWLRTNLAALLDGYTAALDEVDRQVVVSESFRRERDDALQACLVLGHKIAKLEARLEAKDAVIAAGLRTINSGDEALHALRVQFAADRDKLQAELHDARAREPRP